ncbi:glycosyltransferase [uncultured Sphingobacterium sp.]|uniref:glycosyltransferase n=1 Tax=uncultured Sphingobacterium sp. TaxID=182688 RepID=UPI0025E2DB34|nr:glycosyltransferase [uncultured Sphingobacterium sp.]
MKVLHIINGLGVGGAEKLITDILPLFRKKNIETDLLLLNGIDTPFLRELKRSFSGNIFFLGNSYYNPLYIYKIISYLKNYDIVHVHLFPSQYFVAFAKFLSRSKIKLIFTEHNTVNRRISNAKFRRLERFIYSYYSKIICITDEVKLALIDKLSLPTQKLITINNGINLDLIHDSIKENREKFGYADSDKLIIMVAAFRKQKDQDSVIRALISLPLCYKLILVGDGDRRGELTDLVDNLNLLDRVNFLGVRTDVYNLIKMCDIAILSSHWEGFGLAAAEAMACGIPVLASNVPGLAQVVEGGGMLFEKTDILDLAEKILKLENQQFYMQQVKKGLEKAQTYSINQMVDKTIDLYNNICIS